MIELTVIEVTLKALIRFILWCVVCGITVLGFLYVIFMIIYCTKIVTKVIYRKIKEELKKK